METLEDIVRRQFGHLMATICGLEAQLAQAQERIKELERDKAGSTPSDG